MRWAEYDGGRTVGAVGSEGGRIIKDETYFGSVRITLEELKVGFAVTVGVYGVFVHTACFDSSEAPVKYEQMKNELSGFFDKGTADDEEIEFYRQFADKY